MKSITFLITVLLVMGLSAAHAQQKTRDILFPDYAKDQIRLKGTIQPLGAKPSEALITSPKALRDRIFKTTGGGAAPATAPAAKLETKQLGSSKSLTEADKEMKEQQATIRTKTLAPKLEQQETEQKPKN
ncbi:hypothetical protein [Chitinophaga niabensis]|uniref:Uncharacterized protein n=1 Tax=Chitinophaga niabensis TaxID=536979 RepID=A0A1N6GXI4_9BACT|nr:hypothetical protein [Chitinophaga niabensis]SIO12162.1 hypothetical protein SAMN04488055_3038 [Chitinophaga niabensis]